MRSVIRSSFNLGAPIGADGQMIRVGEKTWLPTQEAVDQFLPVWVEAVREDGYEGPLYLIERFTVDSYSELP